ncbi:MAG TPA: hypothetical protein VFA75_12285 [Nevskia sp.]|nr:hypothetical protein [Nevskia sp.]
MQIPPGTRIALVLLTATAIAACGARGFSKPGATQQDFDTDLRWCEYEANRAVNPCFHGTRCQHNDARNACMERKGWTIGRDPDRFMIHR